MTNKTKLNNLLTLENVSDNVCARVECCVSNHKTTTSEQHRKTKLGMQFYFNPTKRNIKKKLGFPPPPPPPRIGFLFSAQNQIN